VSTLGDMTAHFSSNEFACKCKSKGLPTKHGYCGGKVWIRPRLVDKLEELRSALGGKAITVNSGCRCAEYNAYVGGAPGSQHKLGTAADIQVAGFTPGEVADVAEKLGFGGVGRYATFTHVDVRPITARWNG